MNSHNPTRTRQTGAAIAIAQVGLTMAVAIAVLCVLPRTIATSSVEDTVSPVATQPAVVPKPEPISPLTAVNESGRRALVSHLSRRYRIAAEATEMLVNVTYDTGEQIGLDPLLILAVMAIESRFNPIAESGTGAKGLMQVIPKYHWDKLGGKDQEQNALSPVVNIRLGTRVLKEYIESTGSLEAGLQKYNGALWDGDNQYAQRILAERGRYLQVVHAHVALQSNLPDESSHRAARRSQPDHASESVQAKSGAASLPM